MTQIDEKIRKFEKIHICSRYAWEAIIVLSKFLPWKFIRKDTHPFKICIFKIIFLVIVINAFFFNLKEKIY